MSDLSPGAVLLGLGGEPILLASLSPRRRALLTMLGIHYESVVPGAPEGDRAPGESPEAYVTRLARAKACSVREAASAYAVLAADTIVYLDGAILEKPRHDADAAELLGRLSGRWHEVFTGVCLLRLGDGKIVVGHEVSRVRFSTLTDSVIRSYIATGEPADKAGAYGIQGYGGLLVDRIEGCYFNVMGLPLPRLRRLARELEESP